MLEEGGEKDGYLIVLERGEVGRQTAMTSVVCRRDVRDFSLTVLYLLYPESD